MTSLDCLRCLKHLDESDGWPRLSTALSPPPSFLVKEEWKSGEVSKGSCPMGRGLDCPHIDTKPQLYHAAPSNFRDPPISSDLHVCPNVQTTVITPYCFQEAQRIWMQLVRPSMRHSQHQIVLCGHPSLDELCSIAPQICHQKARRALGLVSAIFITPSHPMAAAARSSPSFPSISWSQPRAARHRKPEQKKKRLWQCCKRVHSI